MDDSPAAVEALGPKIESGAARAGVVGLGYVGLPLAVELARAGFAVIGVDKDPARVEQVNRGDSYIPDVESTELRSLVEQKRIRATVDDAALAECDAVSICVPTPLRKTRDPDMTFVMDAAEALARYLKSGSLVILESTTYPGTTEEAVLPVLSRSGRRVGRDFCLCFSPERVDPGNQRYKTRDIPKVIGGVTPRCTELGAAYYARVMETVVPVSSTRVAEMVKLLENTFRMINIGLANEMAIMCDYMQIDVWEVIEAAATKPFGFMPFFPGPGLGGHCIPVDPHYLAWKTKQAGYEPRFIELASQINGRMPEFIVAKVQGALNAAKKPVNGSKILIAGAAYKRDVSDVRESPALDIIGLLQRLGAEVSYSDPHVPRIELDDHSIESRPLLETARVSDCVVIVTDHSAFDYRGLVEAARLIVDSRNALKGIQSDRIVRL